MLASIARITIARVIIHVIVCSTLTVETRTRCTGTLDELSSTAKPIVTRRTRAVGHAGTEIVALATATERGIGAWVDWNVTFASRVARRTDARAARGARGQWNAMFTCGRGAVTDRYLTNDARVRSRTETGKGRGS